MPPTISSCCPLLLPSIFPSIRVFSIVSVLCIRWSKYCSCSFRISPSNEYSGVISFRIYLLDLLSVQETLKSLLQYHSSKAWVLWCFRFSSVQSLSFVWLFVTPWITACQASLSITNSWSSLKPISIESCHPTISSSVVPFYSCPQFLPALGSFPMSQLFAWGGQSTRVSTSASVLPMNTQD